MDALDRILDSDLATVRGLTPRRFAWTMLFVALFALWSSVANVALEDGLSPSLASFARFFPALLRHSATWLVPTMVAVSIADALPLHGARRTLALVVALALAAFVGGLMNWYDFDCSDGCDRTAHWHDASRILGSSLGIFVNSSAIALSYFFCRSDKTIAAALHASELARVDAGHARLQSSLKMMQARVDPAFLFATLHDIATRCETDRKGGAQLLDLLIQYLRSALPNVRATGSTFERESGLLRAHLAIVALRSDGAIATTSRFDQSLGGAAFPPMVLVPMVAPFTSRDAAAGEVNVDAVAVDNRIRVTVMVRGRTARPMADAAPLAEVVERVHAVYRDTASFVVDRTSDGVTSVTLDIPNEPADRDHR